MLSEEVVVALALGVPSLIVAVLALIVAYLTYLKAADARVDQSPSWPPVMLDELLAPSSNTLPTAMFPHRQMGRRRFESPSEQRTHVTMLPPTPLMGAQAVHPGVQASSGRLAGRDGTLPTHQQPNQTGASSTSNSVNYGGAASWDPGYHHYLHPRPHYQMGPPGTRAGPGDMHLDERRLV